MKQDKLTGYASVEKPWLKYYKLRAAEYVMCDLEQSIYGLLRRVNENHLGYTALDYFGTKISYEELFNRIEQVGAAFKGYGVKQGDYVTVCMPNMPETVYFIYALNMLGAVPCLVNPEASSEEIAKRANETNSKLVASTTDIIKSKISPIVEDLIAEKVIDISMNFSIKSINAETLLLSMKCGFSKHKHTSGKITEYKEFLAQGEGIFIEEAPFKKDAPALMVYTRGTTGEAKGVVLTNENLIASKKCFEHVTEVTGENTAILGIMPSFTAYGASCVMNHSLCKGWKIILIPDFESKDFGSLIKRHKPATVIALSGLWVELAEQGLKTDL